MRSPVDPHRARHRGALGLEVAPTAHRLARVVEDLEPERRARPSRSAGRPARPARSSGAGTSPRCPGCGRPAPAASCRGGSCRRAGPRSAAGHTSSARCSAPGARRACGDRLAAAASSPDRLRRPARMERVGSEHVHPDGRRRVGAGSSTIARSRKPSPFGETVVSSRLSPAKRCDPFVTRRSCSPPLPASSAASPNASALIGRPRASARRDATLRTARSRPGRRPRTGRRRTRSRRSASPRPRRPGGRSAASRMGTAPLSPPQAMKSFSPSLSFIGASSGARPSGRATKASATASSSPSSQTRSSKSCPTFTVSPSTTKTTISPRLASAVWKRWICRL